MNLFDAIREGSEGRVCSLTKADPTLLEKAEEASGDVPLMVAVEHEKVDMVKLLLQGGANVDGAGHRGETALIRAIKKGNEALVALLLDNGAKTDLADAVENTPLMVASMIGKLVVVKLVFEAMLRAGLECALNWKGGQTKTALHHAAAGGHFDVVAYLLCKEARVGIKDFIGRTPLMLACEQAPLEVVQILLVVGGGQGQGLDATDNQGETALHRAARGGNKEVVPLLLRKGLQAGSTNREGGTPLMLACEEGHRQVVQMLLEATQGEGVDEQDLDGMTALHYAAKGGDKDVAAFLLSKGAQANTRDEAGSTALMVACETGNLEVVEMLFDATQGQGLEEQDNDGCTALHKAAIGGHNEVAAFLLSKGADTSSRDVFGRTPFLFACWAAGLELVQMVLAATEGQGLEERDRDGETALHNAAIAGTKELVAFLLGTGVKADIKNNKQETALMTACYYSNRDVVRLLLKHTGVQGVNETNSEGRTVLHLAMADGWRADSELVRVLLMAGADPDTADNGGRTPRQLADQADGHTGCVETFEVSLHVPGDDRLCFMTPLAHMIYIVYGSCTH
jgi:cytohesin